MILPKINYFSYFFSRAQARRVRTVEGDRPYK